MPRLQDKVAAVIDAGGGLRSARKRLADGFIESYLGWRDACDEVRLAYRAWQTCKPPQRLLAFGSYCAALDREELAAGVHSSWAERLEG
jgi:hypothetical protein